MFRSPIRPGTFHAIVGENGAGKSTLVKCLLGYQQADSGEISRRRKAVHHHFSRGRTPRGHGHGVPAFHADPLADRGRKPLFGPARSPRHHSLERTTHAHPEFLGHAPFQVDLDRRVAHLAAGEKQKVEILKQLYLETRMLILDEPTSVLTPGEADEVLGILRGMVEAEKLSVVMITHKLREVMQFADEVTVLRRGRLRGSLAGE